MRLLGWEYGPDLRDLSRKSKDRAIPPAFISDLVPAQTESGGTFRHNPSRHRPLPQESSGSGETCTEPQPEQALRTPDCVWGVGEMTVSCSRGCHLGQGEPWEFLGSVIQEEGGWSRGQREHAAECVRLSSAIYRCSLS